MPITSIPTAASLRKAHRRQAGKTLSLVQAVNEMKRGAELHLSYERGRPFWRLTTGPTVAPEIAALIIRSPSVIAGNDALFPDAASQTWRFLHGQ